MFERLTKISPLLAAIGGILIGAIGTVTTGYISAVNSEISSINEDIKKFQSASTELLQTLQAFADKARKGGSVNDEQQKVLTKEITALFGQADALAARDTGVATEFRNYSAALVRLRKTAETMNGPLDAKPFVEAVSQYSVASQLFVEAAIRSASFRRRII